MPPHNATDAHCRTACLAPQDDAAAVQQQLIAAHAELQQLQQQVQQLSTTHKRLLGDKARLAHTVQQLQVHARVVCRGRATPPARSRHSAAPRSRLAP
jgi:hypothetical protein